MSGVRGIRQQKASTGGAEEECRWDGSGRNRGSPQIPPPPRLIQGVYQRFSPSLVDYETFKDTLSPQDDRKFTGGSRFGPPFCCRRLSFLKTPTIFPL